MASKRHLLVLKYALCILTALFSSCAEMPGGPRPLSLSGNPSVPIPNFLFLRDFGGGLTVRWKPGDEVGPKVKLNDRLLGDLEKAAFDGNSVPGGKPGSAGAPKVPDERLRQYYSSRMGFLPDGSENFELLAAVDRWIGTPYLWGGCSPEGVDCSCLVKRIYEEVYGRAIARTSMIMCSEDSVPVSDKRLKEGDLICFDMKNEGISHVGIYLKNGRFAHASLSGGVRISSLNHEYYRQRFIIGGRVVDRGPVRLASSALSLKNLIIVSR